MERAAWALAARFALFAFPALLAEACPFGKFAMPEPGVLGALFKCWICVKMMFCRLWTTGNRKMRNKNQFC